jgi:hypothetical protein
MRDKRREMIHNDDEHLHSLKDVLNESSSHKTHGSRKRGGAHAIPLERLFVDAGLDNDGRGALQKIIKSKDDGGEGASQNSTSYTHRYQYTSKQAVLPGRIN